MKSNNERENGEGIDFESIERGDSVTVAFCNYPGERPKETLSGTVTRSKGFRIDFTPETGSDEYWETYTSEETDRIRVYEDSGTVHIYHPDRGTECLTHLGQNAEIEIDEEPVADGGSDLSGNGEMHVPDDDAVILPDGGVVTDKDGKPVDERVAVLMDRLQDETNADRVLCHWYKSGRIGYWSKTSTVRGNVVDVAQEEGFRLDHATTRDGQGYAELVPMGGDDDGGRKVMTDGGNTCVECGATLPEEIEEDTGVYCPECGHGQLVPDGGRRRRWIDWSEYKRLHREREIRTDGGPRPEHQEVTGGVQCSTCGEEWRTPLGAARCCEMEPASE